MNKKIRTSKFFICCILVLLSITYSVPSIAEWNSNYSLTITLASYHLNREKKLNEFNPGFLVRYSNNLNSEFSIGFYRNSFKRNSFVAMKSWLPVNQEYIRSGMFIGLVTGYPVENVLPVLGLQMQIVINHPILNVRFVPPVKYFGTKGVFGFELLNIW